MATRTRRIAVCEDSKSFAAALRKFLERDPELDVVGVFETAEELLGDLDRLAPDLVTMDLELPGMNGVEAIDSIMGVHPVPILVISAHAGRRADRTAHALAAGAVEAVHKDSVGVAQPDDVWATALRSRIKRLASLRLDRRAKPDANGQPPARASRLGRPFGVVGIGASTGGPPALTAVLSDLPADYPLPVLVVQHIASGFGEGLVDWLNGRIAVPVRVAQEGATAGPGVWFAPDDAHLVVDSSLQFSFDRETNSGAHRPSLDVLFKSLAEAAGPEALAVVLTGMGRDGAEGAKAIRGAGGALIAQDESTSVVFGMPRAAAELGADLVLPLQEIGATLRRVQRVGVKG